MSNFDKTLGFLEGRQEQANRIVELEKSLAHERQQLPALLDELEPAWREAYSDPLNLVRVLQAKAQEATDVFHERQQAEAWRDWKKLNDLVTANANAWKARAEAAEAERNAELAKVGMEGHTLAELIAHHRANAALAQAFDAVPISQLAAKLLALAVEQRRALDEVMYELSDDMLASKPKQQARAALATDLDALVAEAKLLGIDGKIEGQEKTEA